MKGKRTVRSAFRRARREARFARRAHRCCGRELDGRDWYADGTVEAPTGRKVAPTGPSEHPSSRRKAPFLCSTEAEPVVGSAPKGNYNNVGCATVLQGKGDRRRQESRSPVHEALIQTLLKMKNINIKRAMKVGQEVLLGWEAEAAELSLGGKTRDQMKELADEAQAAIDRLAKLRNEEKARPAE